MFPQYLPNRWSLAYARTSITLAAKRSTRVLTVSESSKRDILRFVDIPPGKIDVIYNAYDERFRDVPNEEAVARVRERFQLQDQFVLYAGNVKPHKNLERLIEAFHLVRSRGLDHLKLVLIGDEISKYTALRRAVHRHQLHKYVRFLGFLPLDTLAVLYRLAGVFVFPSLYEGFGLPPLEAMASGTPVVTSNVSSLPEVAGNAAVLVDPYNASAIADGIYRVLTDAGESNARRSFRGSRRSAACARSTVRSHRECGRRKEDRPRPRLAHGHARRREGARGRLRTISAG
jgi:glycosyltransferase involved in cell wall biosynthesis